MYLDRDGNVLRGLSTKGYLAAGVPGNVAGFELALAKYGTMKRAAVMAPAIRLAKRGFVLEQGDVDLLAIATRDFREDAPSAAVFLRNGQPYAAGERLVQKDLARTLERIATHGNAGFYEGPVADAIVAASVRGRRHHHQGGSRPLPGERARADRVRLSRLQDRLGAAAELRRRDPVRNSRHPRRLSAAGMGLPVRARGAPPGRGDAPRVSSIATAISAIPISSAIRSSACWTGVTPRRSAPPSIPARPASSRDLKPGVAPHEGSRTPRTIRSSTRTATRSRSRTRSTNGSARRSCRRPPASS